MVAAALAKPAGKRRAAPDPAKVRACFEAWREANPHPTTELNYDNPYQLLVAVVLSAQATDRGVNRATEGLFRAVKRPQDVLDMGPEALEAAVKTIGLYRTKARNVMALSEILVRDHGGEVPLVREALEALPGVGRKTANVVLNTLTGAPVMAVDTHVFRLARRLGWSRGETPRAVEDDLDRVVPEDFRRDAHHWLILHGRYVCVARAPKCAQCIVAPWCDKVGIKKQL